MSVRIAAPLAALVLGSAVTMTAVQPPETRPEPPPEFTKVCVRCHPAEKIIEGRRSRAQWDQVLEQMVARGATGTEQEFDAVFEFLVTHYGRVAINTAPPDEIAQVLHLDQGVADTIVKSRPLADFEALAKLPGVPAADLEKMRDAIVFQP
jgi:hypothetical protein